MTEHPVDADKFPDHVDPDKEHYDELTELATDAEKRAEEVREARDTVAAATSAIAAIDTRSYVSTADAMASSPSVAGEVFSNDFPDPLHASLSATADQMASSMRTAERSKVRERFLAAELGFVADDRRSATADTILVLLASAVGGQPKKGIDPRISTTVGRLAEAWRVSERRLFERLADRYAGEWLAGSELAEHVALMSIVAGLRSTPESRNFAWDHRVEVTNLAEQLMVGMQPGEPVDISKLYERAIALEHDQYPLPTPLAAEIVRLALAALSGDRAEVPHPPDAATQALLEAAQRRIERMAADKLTRDDREQAWLAAEHDLGQLWTYFVGIRRAQLESAQGKKRVSALDAAIGPDVARLLSAVSEARRTGNGTELAARAVAASDAITQAEFRFLELIGDLNNLALAEKYAVEYDVLQLLHMARTALVTQCRSAAEGRIVHGGPLAAAITVAVLQMTRSRSRGEARRGDVAKPYLIESHLTDQLERAKVEKRPWATQLAEVMAEWTRAARDRRLTAESEPTSKDDPTLVTLAALDDVTSRAVAALEAARAAISADAGNASSQRLLLDTVDSTLMRMAEWLRNASSLDPDLVRAGMPKLAAEVEKHLSEMPTVDDVAAEWSSRNAELLAKVSSSKKPSFDRDLGRALSRWRTAVDAYRVDTAAVAQQTWEVLSALSEYRYEVSRTVSDPEILSEYDDLFDIIAWSLAVKLRALPR